MDNLFSYYNLLTGNENGTGIPSTDDLVEMNKLVADMREIAKRVDILNITPFKFTGSLRDLNFIERLQTSSVTPLQRTTLRSIINIANLNNQSLTKKGFPMEDMPAETVQEENRVDRNILVNELNYVFANRLANTHLIQANSPLIVYHGTNKKFDRFLDAKIKDFKYHFGSQTAALNRAELKAKISGQVIVMPFYLNIKNPLIMRGLRWLGCQIYT